MSHDEPIHGEDASLERQAEAMQNECAQLAGRLVAALRDAGYEIAIVRVGKVVRSSQSPGEAALPAATAVATHPSVDQCLRLEAGELRRLADEFEAQCDESGRPEATAGYTYAADAEEFIR